MNEEEQNAKALHNIETYGCHIINVLEGDTAPGFAYSIGIEATSKQPDLIILGLNGDLAIQLINEYNRRVRSGESFNPDQPYQDFLEGFPVLFSPVLKQHYGNYLGWGRWFNNGDDFPMLQLVYPDTSGRWPWDKQASDDFRWFQPLICQPPTLN